MLILPISIPIFLLSMQKHKSTPPWRSKLTPYQDEILTAWYQERATLKTIQERLGKYGITITLSGISRFIRCRKNSIDPHLPIQPIKSAAPLKDPLSEFTEKSVAELEAEWRAEQK